MNNITDEQRVCMLTRAVNDLRAEVDGAIWRLERLRLQLNREEGFLASAGLRIEEKQRKAELERERSAGDGG